MDLMSIALTGGIAVIGYFLKQTMEDLKDLQILPEVGDVIFWYENYYEVDGVVDNQYFAGATVVMLPDNDLAGWKYAKLVAAALTPVVKSLRIVDLPVIYPTDDAWEWVNQYGGTRQQLAELAKQAQPITSVDDVTMPEGLLAAAEVVAPATPNATNATAPGNVHQETDKTYKPFKIESWQSVKDEPVNWLVQLLLLAL